MHPSYLLLIGEEIAPIKKLHDCIYDHANASSGTIPQSDLETVEVKVPVCINKEKKKPVLLEAKPTHAHPSTKRKKYKFKKIQAKVGRASSEAISNEGGAPIEDELHQG